MNKNYHVSEYGLIRSEQEWDVDDNVKCETNKIGCEESCYQGSGDPITKGNLNSDSVCVFVVFPGDVDLNGKADQNDIISIVNNWGNITSARNKVKDLDGNPLISNTEWKPQFVEYPFVTDSCQTRADANGDGFINVVDIMIMVNIALEI